MLDEVCWHWALDVSRVRVKFVMPNNYKMICPIELETDFQRMCYIYHMVNINNVKLIVNDVKGTSDSLAKSFFHSVKNYKCWHVS